jgi:hypothetical protein
MFARRVRTHLIYTLSHRERPKENFGSSHTPRRMPRIRRPMFLPANRAPHRDAVDEKKLQHRARDVNWLRRNWLRKNLTRRARVKLPRKGKETEGLNTDTLHVVRPSQRPAHQQPRRTQPPPRGHYAPGHRRLYFREEAAIRRGARVRRGWQCPCLPLSALGDSNFRAPYLPCCGDLPPGRDTIEPRRKRGQAIILIDEKTSAPAIGEFLTEPLREWPPARSWPLRIPHSYSSSKVIHGWREEPSGTSPQPTVNNFGGGVKMLHQQLLFLLNREVGHAGPGRRIPHSNVATFFWRYSLRILRLVVKEYSEPFACKCKLAETNSYKSFHAARPACLA